jgi:hypothetical protein
MNTKEIELTAVIDRNLMALIRELGLEQRLSDAELLCTECGKILTF